MKNNFNRVAWCYDFLSKMIFGNKVKQSQILLLGHIKNNDRILIIGGGTGWIINEILKLRTVNTIDYVEFSVKMLNKAKTITPLNPEVIINYIHGDENSLTKHETYDAVIAYYFFDMFKHERLELVISKIVNCLKTEGKILVADFNLTSNSPLKHKIMVNIMYLFFKITCSIESDKFVNFTSMFKKYHLIKETSFPTCKGLILSEVYKKQMTRTSELL